MNLNQLRVFHAVASLKSFTRASESLFLTQPGISKHIRQLEEFYGIRLFERLGKGVQPTQAGEILFESTGKIFELIDDAGAKMDDLKGLRGGKIKIGASFTAGTYIIPKLLGRFNQLYPDVKLFLDISLSHRIAEKVISNEIDLGFIGAPYEDNRLITRILCEDRLVIIIPEDHPWSDRESVGFSELADQSFILSGKGSGTRDFLERQLENREIKIKKKMEFGNTEAVKKAVAAGIGISVLSESAIMDEERSGRIKSLNVSDCSLKRAFYFTYHKERYRSHATQALIHLLERNGENHANQK
jgi:DNA-binding transcriptional LysR family regulator